MQIEEILTHQRHFFESGATFPVETRIAALRRLRDAIERHEQEIGDALRADLGKSDFEGFMCETGLVLSEIGYLIRHTRRFAARRRVHTPMAQFAAASYKQPTP